MLHVQLCVQVRVNLSRAADAFALVIAVLSEVDRNWMCGCTIGLSHSGDNGSLAWRTDATLG
ncbi:hypothetical protein [Nocardia sp. CY41]|uniref:hypothetical protein n=1 Tax=Nocardia sp. CY41 TaxID=2608686 RepID=UPI00135963A7|nr:hypothetical protein [Nocardia sp. CY41]